MFWLPRSWITREYGIDVLVVWELASVFVGYTRFRGLHLIKGFDLAQNLGQIIELGVNQILKLI